MSTEGGRRLEAMVAQLEVAAGEAQQREGGLRVQMASVQTEVQRLQESWSWSVRGLVRGDGEKIDNFVLSSTLT